MLIHMYITLYILILRVCVTVYGQAVGVLVSVAFANRTHALTTLNCIAIIWIINSQCDNLHNIIIHDSLISSVFMLLMWQGWLGSRVVIACWTQAQKAWVQIAVATLSGNSLGQTVHTHRASVHQAAKLVAALLRVAGVTVFVEPSYSPVDPGGMQG